MKKMFSEEVEKGRMMSGPYSSRPHRNYGAFLIVCPLTKTELKIIVGSADSWREGRMPEPAWDHVSVSTEKRVPSWKEMCWVKDLFFEPEECVVQFHPPKSQYVNNHPNVLHLWRVVGQFPMPPVECV